MERVWTSRKFWAAMTWQGVFTMLLYLGKLPPDAYEGLAFVTLGGYFAANVGDKFSQRRNG